MKYTYLALVAAVMMLGSCSTLKNSATSTIAVTGDAYSDYITKYSGMAVAQMEKYGIPASITLAQGILESNAGRSTLAQSCNNHFGIKCHSDWDGRKTYHDDDASQECFRCYDSAEESYRDHSLFLVNGARYKSLFALGTKDYKGWAKGLKQAGYATSPTYADKLIELIERYGLDVYDSKNALRVKDGQIPHATTTVNGLECVVLREGETMKSIAREFKKSALMLRQYNEINSSISIPAGTNIFIERKKNRADAASRTYKVKEDDSIWSISQQFGVKMKPLIRRNRLSEDNPMRIGMILLLR